MFERAWKGPWLSAIESYLFMMLKRIGKLRTQYQTMNPNNMVPSMERILRKNWDESVQFDCHVANQGLHHISLDKLHGSGPGRGHKLDPEHRYCSCGEWSDMKLPCVHACCWARKHRNIRYDTFVKDYMEDVHSVDFLQNLYSQNINPIVTDNIEYDLTSKPNPTVRMSGRPPVQRIRNRSRYANPDDSPTICSICNRRGHNR